MGTNLQTNCGRQLVKYGQQNIRSPTRVNSQHVWVNNMSLSQLSFDQLPRELRVEILQHCSVQTLGRFIQTSSQSEALVGKSIWQRRIEEINPSIWRKLKKKTRKGDLKLLCAIVASSVRLMWYIVFKCLTAFRVPPAAVIGACLSNSP